MTSSVTVLGLGPMGHALAAAFVLAHHPTTVWNRTPGKADDLDVTVAASSAEAIAAAELVIVCVRDYRVAGAILDADALRGRTLVNFSGGSPRQARELAAWAAEHGIDYLDGVIVAVPEVIGGPDAALYLSGPAEVYQSHRSALAALGENANHVGEEPGLAAAFDASLQDLFWTSMSGVVHMFALAAAEGIDAADIAGQAKSMLGFFPDMVDMVAGQVAAGSFPGDAGTISAAAGIMDHILETVRVNGLDNGILAAARAEVGRAIDAGVGDAGYARLAAPLP